MKKKGFTLLEIVLSIVVFGLLFSAIMSIYLRMINVKREFDARNYILLTTYNMVEKMNILLKDYTIDYEEYFNRRMAGCNSAAQMSGWYVGTGGNCTVNTAYGNQSPVDNLTNEGASLINGSGHILYHCSNNTSYIDDTTYSYVITSPTVVTGGGCMLVGEPQSFGQYRQQFIDVKSNADESPSLIGDDDDTDVGHGPIAIPDNENIPELYLISKDKKSRLFFRRKLVQELDTNGDHMRQPSESLYVIQMLQLRGFDAGTNHSFDAGDPTNLYMYDGQVDTWACDYEKGFVCNGTGVNPLIYSGFNLPRDENDGRINLFGSDITVSNWRLQIYPSKDPVYAWAESDKQANPYVRLFLTTYLYAPARGSKINLTQLNNISFSLQTAFNIKSNY